MSLVILIQSSHTRRCLKVLMFSLFILRKKFQVWLCIHWFESGDTRQSFSSYFALLFPKKIRMQCKLEKNGVSLWWGEFNWMPVLVLVRSFLFWRFWSQSCTMLWVPYWSWWQQNKSIDWKFDTRAFRWVWHIAKECL